MRIRNQDVWIGAIVIVALWCTGQAWAGEPLLDEVDVGPPPTAYVPPPTTPTTTTLPPQPPQAAAASVVPIRGTSVQATATFPPPTTLPGWAGEIPAYRPGGACTQAEADIVARKFRAAGASDDTVWWALRMFSRESNCDHTAFNHSDRTRDTSFSLCQMNARAGFFSSGGILAGFDRWATLTDFDYAVDACVTLWQACGRLPWRSGNYGCEVPTS